MHHTITYTGFNKQNAEIDLYIAANSTQLVVFYHGFKGFKDWGAWHAMCPYFTQAGYSIALINGSHNGVNVGETEITNLQLFANNTISVEQFDILQAICASEEFLHTQNIVVSKTHLIGHSRGGGAALIFATHHANKVSTITSWAGVGNWETFFSFADLEQWKTTNTIFITNSRTGQQYPLNYSLVSDYQTNKEAYNLENCALIIGTPLLFVHGELDTVVPISQAQKLHANCLHAVLVQIPNTNHTFNCSHPHLGTLPPAMLTCIQNTIDFLIENE